MNKKKAGYLVAIIFFYSGLLLSQNQDIIEIRGENITLEFDNNTYSRVISKIDDRISVFGDFRPTEFIGVGGETIKNFKLVSYSDSPLDDETGTGKQYKIIAQSEQLQKTILVNIYNDFPTMLFMQVVYENISNGEIKVDSWTNNNYEIRNSAAENNKVFWSYLPGSYGWEHDWVQPLKNGFHLDNYMGMNHVDYGGGTPVVDVWHRYGGLAVGHVEKVPKLVSLPVNVPDDSTATIAVHYNYPVILQPHEALSTFKTFVAVHKGDHYQTLSEYGRFMISQGFEFKDAPETAYETIWCAWGYEKDFTLRQIYGTFPKIRELGINWIVLDYGWDTGVGDNIVNREKFPDGDEGMKRFVDSIHSLGAKAKLWWMPLSVEPETEFYKNNPENLLLDENNSPVRIEFFKSYFLCPAVDEVKKRTVELVFRAMQDWGYDGFKIDGNHLNSVPPCYNTQHKHSRPEESVESLAGLYKLIYETATGINPDVVVEICPCGTNYSFYNLPYMNQAVASDPQSSWQIRLKGKTIKALTGSKVAYYGDHVELSDGKTDFASTVGVGGIIGTKFIWPEDSHTNIETGDISLTPQKEKEWKKWIEIYNEKMLSKGNYLGWLYDIGFDYPEGHVIQKGDTIYYAFYADRFDGELEFRGLNKNKKYKLFDYVNNIDMGIVTVSDNIIRTSFTQYKLIQATPIKN